MAAALHFKHRSKQHFLRCIYILYIFLSVFQLVGYVK